MSIAKDVAEPEFAAFVGVDWADRQHAYALQETATGRRQKGEVEHSPEGIEAWAQGLMERFGGRRIAICLEQSRGALVALLLQYECFTLYPVNPATVARLRQAFFPSGAKDDLSDAELLLDVLTRHRERLRRLEPDTVEIRTLQLLVEERRRLVNEKTRQKNRLTAKLKLYYPQLLQWFDQIDTPLVCDLLQRWPTLQALQRAKAATLESFFARHRYRHRQRYQQWWESLRQAVPATQDAALLLAASLTVRTLVRLLGQLRRGIAELDEQIQQQAAAHPDFALFKSLPAAGAVLAPRLLAACGSRRERFQKAADLQAYSGIAPVLERSGQRQITRFRWAAPLFLRQSFHEFAAFSIRKSVWAKAYYQQQRAQGKSHHCAVRALAFKWIRILHRCWQNRTPYDEGLYLAALARRQSPLAAALAAPVHAA